VSKLHVNGCPVDVSVLCALCSGVVLLCVVCVVLCGVLCCLVWCCLVSCVVVSVVVRFWGLEVVHDGSGGLEVVEKHVELVLVHLECYGLAAAVELHAYRGRGNVLQRGGGQDVVHSPLRALQSGQVQRLSTQVLAQFGLAQQITLTNRFHDVHGQTQLQIDSDLSKRQKPVVIR